MGTQVQKCREAQSSFLQEAENRWSEHCICIFSFSTEGHCGFTYMQITTKLVSSFLSFLFKENRVDNTRTPKLRAHHHYAIGMFVSRVKTQ